MAVSWLALRIDPKRYISVTQYLAGMASGCFLMLFDHQEAYKLHKRPHIHWVSQKKIKPYLGSRNIPGPPWSQLWLLSLSLLLVVVQMSLPGQKSNFEDPRTISKIVSKHNETHQIIFLIYICRYIPKIKSANLLRRSCIFNLESHR